MYGGTNVLFCAGFSVMMQESDSDKEKLEGELKEVCL